MTDNDIPIEHEFANGKAGHLSPGSQAAFDAQIERERTMMILQPPPNRTIFPSFYAAIHRAWNEELRRFADDLRRESATGGFCPGREEPYDPDEHACFEFAGALRVELHAAGIMLSNDGNGGSGNAFSSQPGGAVRGPGYGNTFDHLGIHVGTLNDARRSHECRCGAQPSEDSFRAMIAYYEHPVVPLGDVGIQSYPPKRGFWHDLARRLFGMKIA